MGVELLLEQADADREGNGQRQIDTGNQKPYLEGHEGVGNEVQPLRGQLGHCDHADDGGVLDEVDEGLLKICFDTGHHSYAGFDPVAFMKKYLSRISYMHFKDIDPKVKADVIANRTGFYEACGQGIFCNLGQGDVEF